jgi:hypothetical protein
MAAAQDPPTKKAAQNQADELRRAAEELLEPDAQREQCRRILISPLRTTPRGGRRCRARAGRPGAERRGPRGAGRRLGRVLSHPSDAAIVDPRSR